MNQTQYKPIHFSSQPGYEPSEPGEPDTGAPGTQQRIRLMARRLELGEPIFNPNDPTTFEETRGYCNPVVRDNAPAKAKGLDAVKMPPEMEI